MLSMRIYRNILTGFFIAFIFFGLSLRGAYAQVYSSENGKYTVEVKSDFSFHAGKAFYEVKDEDGEIISEFKTDLSPIAIIPLNNGKRFIGFYGGVGQTVVVTQLRFYDMKGKLIGKHGIFATGSGGQDISESEEFFVYSWWNDKKSGIDLFDTQTGKKIWSKSFKKMVAGVKISGDGQWLVTMFAKKKLKEIYLLDNEGSLIWSGNIKTRHDCAITSINEDGSFFEIVESKMLYNEKDGYMHNRLVKKTVYANEDGEVEIEKTVLPPKKSSKKF
jgi:hypothetical protein